MRFCGCHRVFSPFELSFTNTLSVLNNCHLDTAFDDTHADGVTLEAGGVVVVEILLETLAMPLGRGNLTVPSLTNPVSGLILV